MSRSGKEANGKEMNEKEIILLKNLQAIELVFINIKLQIIHLYSSIFLIAALIN